MSFFDEANRDAVTVAPEMAASGRRVGFLESWAVGWEEQVRGAAMYGIENAMWERDNEQIRAMRNAGIENVPALSPNSIGWFADNLPGPASGVETYLNTARFYEDGGDPAFAAQLEEYDTRINELREQYPQLNLQTSREMWEAVQATAQEYENRAFNDRRTIGGHVGSFIGGTLGAMNPNTDPLNFITLGVGGIGRNAAQRIAGQAGAQGLIEGINQITGVQEQRRLLGLEHGFGDAVARVGGAVVGGAALQALGEGVAAGVRRWFRSTPIDQAPPPTPEALQRPTLPDTSQVPPHAIPADETLAAAKLTRAPETFIDYVHERSPLSGTRQGRARTVLDLDYMTTRLEDWEGGAPWATPPKTDTAVTLPRSDFIAPNIQRAVDQSEIDARARVVDPQTFERYDALAERVSTYRRWIDELETVRDNGIQSRLDELDNQIYELEARAAEQGGRRAAKTRKDIAALTQQKAQIVQESARVETPDMARVRKAMMKEDEKMRDLAPLVSRAYARARQEWTDTAGERRAVLDMIRQGRRELPADTAGSRIVDAAEQQVTAATLADRAPILRDAPRVRERLPQDADAADVASAIVADNIKVLDEAIEQYRATLDSVIAGEKNGEIEIAGQSYKLNLDRDKVFVPNEDGTGGREITIRQLLEENKLDEYELEAVGVCSLRKTS